MKNAHARKLRRQYDKLSKTVTELCGPLALRPAKLRFPKSLARHLGATQDRAQRFSSLKEFEERILGKRRGPLSRSVSTIPTGRQRTIAYCEPRPKAVQILAKPSPEVSQRPDAYEMSWLLGPDTEGVRTAGRLLGGELTGQMYDMQGLALEILEGGQRGCAVKVRAWAPECGRLKKDVLKAAWAKVTTDVIVKAQVQLIPTNEIREVLEVK